LKKGFFVAMINLLRALPTISKIINSPKDFYQKTYDYISNLPKENICAQTNFIKIYPSYKISRATPITLDPDVHWKFKKEYQRQLPETFVAMVPGGRVWGDSGTVITSDNKFLADVSVEFGRTADKHSVLSQLRLPPPHLIDGKVAVLSVAGGINYYHWVLDLIPRIHLLQLGGINFSHIDKFIVNGYSLPFHKETLSHLGIPPIKIITSHKRFHIEASQLIIPSLVGNTGNPPKWACDFIRKSFLTSVSVRQQNKSERIYITRAKAKYRKILNEAEIIKVLRRLKFEVLEMESMPVTEQAATFSSAKVIVSPHGAGLTNIVFCNPKTKVIELFSPNYVNVCYWSLSNQMQLEYYYLLGEGKKPPEYVDPHRGGNNIFVNVDSLLNLMQLAGIVN
jgi:capsular polysaccharide biosynthesis protein